ncbi:methyl-accepting chemotaxis protein [Simiduia agarivorans]|uniref:Methyl-accepting chemotaxis protein n=1 Tax=Simiduia agarivorans (strain DSM 21679 / JCM 13881 / BCRC 17597 / SA1) TaxID=1117647 RepID=K4KI04_SIMAS|nr:methyl-accepting chemotaxis protein [Simiduia agarivorans]AFU97825.1 methyl-accepting chemotaxis protein [Simiduia agarivorans SA1 = DSM 21679]
MNWLSKISIKYKILLIPAVGITGFVLYLLFTINSGSQNVNRLNLIQNVYFPVLEIAGNNIVTLDRMNETMSTAASTGEEDMLNSAKRMGANLTENLNRARQLQPERTTEVNQLESQLNTYLEISYGLTASMIDGTVDFSKLAEIAERRNRALEQVNNSLKQFRDQSDRSFTETVRQATETEQDNLKVGLVVGVVTVALLLLISISIAVLITHNVQVITESLKDIAQGEGDLTQRLQRKSEDELGDLVHWFNTFIDKLHNTIGEVIQVISPLTDVAKRLNGVSHETERLSNQQASSSEEVTNAMSDMMRSVNNVAQNAGSAAQAAQDADKEAKAGLNVVQDTVKTINSLANEVERAAEVIAKLESDTDSVAGILDVIKGIAEQTNLLALNAAIEAARAGEQGRGFAVVADEVRTLASRTQESTHEIQTVIEQLQTAAREAVQVMETGKTGASRSVAQAGETGESLAAITNKVTSITDMNKRIAAATEEQQTFAKSIQSNVINMRDASKVAQENTEQVANLSTNLQGLADQLKTVAAQFKV